MTANKAQWLWTAIIERIDGDPFETYKIGPVIDDFHDFLWNRNFEASAVDVVPCEESRPTCGLCRDCKFYMQGPIPDDVSSYSPDADFMDCFHLLMCVISPSADFGCVLWEARDDSD
jgi:hypothetical protein